MISSIMKRLDEKIEKTDTCWNWTAALNQDGYGMFGSEGKVHRAHRFVYELLVGPIPEGLQLDHLCRNRKCCNPEHLEVVTPRENTIRGQAGAHNKNKSTCPQGHEYTEENTYRTKRGRHCRECGRIRTRSYYYANQRTEIASLN